MRAQSNSIGRLIVPMITPRFGHSVDGAGLERLIGFLVEGGVEALFILGTTGEFMHLDCRQKGILIRDTVRFVVGRVPVWVGVSAPAFDETLELIECAGSCGTQAVVLAPLFGSGEPEWKIRSVVEASPLPVVIYNNPEIHGKRMLPLETVEACAAHPKVLGIKDSSGERDYFRELLRLQSASFCVFQGRESLILESLEAGAYGIVAGLANVAPGLCREMLFRRDRETMDRILRAKEALRCLDPDPIRALKKRLVGLGVIRSEETF